jgi:formylglycine-generating enzyme required for sulfatase activity
MIGAKILKFAGFLTLFFFVWFCLAADFSFARNEGKTPLQEKVKVEKRDGKEPGIGEESIQKEYEQKVIPKQAEKKKKKKFPWLLLVGVVIVLGVVLYYYLKNKNTKGDDQIVDPNYDTNVLGIQWMNIPAGEFLMGDNFNEGNPDERPVHAVYLDSYYISKYEVTFDQYDKFCELTDRKKPDDFGWGRANRPVICVSWNDAKAFCDWLSSKTGKNIHLPTEAQWEKAARGTDQRRYPWGNSAPNCGKVNYNSGYGNCQGKTMPVGSYSSWVSPYGVHDMAGNVQEWCLDRYSPTYYLESPYNNPTGPTSGIYYVRRGGAWNCFEFYIRCAFRGYHPAEIAVNTFGFRLCKG